MKNLPNKIYLQVDPNNEKPEDYNDLEGVTFSTDQINKNDIEYVLHTDSKCDRCGNYTSDLNDECEHCSEE